MNLFALVASFRGGVIRAYMGAFPAFTLTGVTAIAGSVAVAVGGTSMTVGFITSGSYLGLHIVFAGGVAASAYAGRTKKLGSGTDILSCLNELADPATLLAGGVFGVIGLLIHYLVEMVLHLSTDLPGFIVILSAVIARLVFGPGGLIGKAAPDEFKEYSTSGGEILCNTILGLGLGTTTGFVYQALLGGRAPAVAVGSYPILYSRVVVASLIFAQTGFAMPATHHIALISTLAAVSSQSPVMDVVFGILTTLFGDLVRETSNSCCNIRIDPPAFTISALTSTVNIIFGNGFFSV